MGLYANRFCSQYFAVGVDGQKIYKKSFQIVLNFRFRRMNTAAEHLRWNSCPTPCQRRKSVDSSNLISVGCDAERFFEREIKKDGYPCDRIEQHLIAPASCALITNAPSNKSMDVRAKQRLGMKVVR